MDVNWARSLYTVLVFVSFALILLVAYNRKSKKGYDDVAQSLIDDDDIPHEDGASVRDYRDNGAK